MSDKPKCATISPVAIIFLIFLTLESVKGFLIPGKEYIFEYEATSSAGVLVPSKAQSAWGFSGLLVVQVDEEAAFMQVCFFFITRKFS